MIPKLSEFMAKEIPDVDFKTIEKVIKAHWNYESTIRKNHCDICLKQLTLDDRNKISPMDFLLVCKKHGKYRQHFRVDLVRKELGIKIEEVEYFQ